MTALAVETTNLSKSYDDQRALDRVDLRVPEGSVYVLVGANGAGKSTTFKIFMLSSSRSLPTPCNCFSRISSRETRIGSSRRSACQLSRRGRVGGE
jgi:ABC-type Mn2+/Zn2+ transport system ATPase subunit